MFFRTKLIQVYEYSLGEEEVETWEFKIGIETTDDDNNQVRSDTILLTATEHSNDVVTQHETKTNDDRQHIRKK